MSTTSFRICSLIFVILSLNGLACKTTALTDSKDRPVLYPTVDSIQISGTLRYTSLEKLVIIIAGSGPTDRNFNSPGLNSNAFKMLADTLCQMGISSFRYDKRGIGESTKVGEEQCTLYDRVDDVNAVSNYTLWS